MSIQTDVNELNNILIEIKRLNKTVAELRKRKKEIEGRITSFLQSKEQPGVKYKGMAIIAEDAKKVCYKSKKDKEQSGIETLKKYGIHNPDEVLKEVMSSMRGEELEMKKLKIKKINKDPSSRF